MPTYFGYVEREADSYINWAEIGKGISDTVNEIDKVRNEKKAALDQASKDFQTKLSEYPNGQNKDANGFAYRYSDNASQFMLMQQRLLKQGKLKLKDYLNSTQNIMDDTESAFGMLKQFQEMYGTKMEQYRKGEISIGEIDNFAYIEKFGNFSNADLFINPLDGSLTAGIVKQDEKGIRTLQPGQENTMTIGVLKQLMNTPIPKYNIDKRSTALADGMGKQIDIINKDGMILSYENIRRRAYSKEILESNDPNRISDALIEANVDAGGITLTSVQKQIDPATKKEVEVKTSTNFQDREDLLAEKYLEIKNKPKDQRTAEEENLLFQVDKSLKGSKQDQDMVVQYEKLERQYIQSAFGTPYDYMSALADNNVICSKNGQPYQGFTTDPEVAKKNPQMILKKFENGTVTYELTPVQKEDAENAVLNQIRLKLDEKMEYKGTYKTQEQIREENAIKREELAIKANQRRPATESEMKEGRTARQYMRQGNLLEQLYYSNNTEDIEEAIQYFLEGNKDVYRTPTGVVVDYIDKKGLDQSRKLEFYDETGKPLGIERFVRSAAPFFYGTDIEPYLDYLVQGIKNKGQIDPETEYVRRGSFVKGSPEGWTKQPGPLKNKAGKSATGGIINLPRN